MSSGTRHSLFGWRLTARQIRARFALWLTAVLAHCAFSTDYWSVCFLVPVGIGLSVVLLCCAVALAITGFQGDADGRRHRGVSVAAIVLGGVLLVGPWGSELGRYARLWRDETRYQAIVQRALADPDAAFPRDVRVDPGPPVRVGFVWSGMVNYWKGVVFDPSGLLARGLPADGTGITLFEFDHLEWAEPLWGAWYYCGFR